MQNKSLFFLTEKKPWEAFSFEKRFAKRILKKKFPKEKKEAKKTMNSKGQEEEGYRLLIEAIIVVFILAIIIGVITQIEEWRWQVSERRLFEGFDKALNSPDGSIVVEKDIVLKANSSYGSRAFEGSTTGIPFECIELDASNSTAFTLQNKNLIQINTLIQTNIYYKCLPGTQTATPECETHCTISFGKDLGKQETNNN